MGPLMAAVTQANQLQILQVMPPSWVQVTVTTAAEYLQTPCHACRCHVFRGVVWYSAFETQFRFIPSSQRLFTK